MDRSNVASWLERYVQAWETNDPAAIGDLFTEDALYFHRPDEASWRGRTEIVAGWLERNDVPGTWTFHHEILAVDGDLAFVRGWTHYVDPSTDFSTLWVIRLDSTGRCVEFTEWWMEHDQENGEANPGGTDERGGA